MLVEQIMTENPLTVTETSRIADAMAVLADAGVRHLPVVRGEDVIGILSDRDFSGVGLALVNDVQDLQQLRFRMTQPVTELMSGGVVTVDRDADVTEVVDMMLEEKLGALPVVESGTRRLVGIVSYVDVLKASRDLFEQA